MKQWLAVVAVLCAPLFSALGATIRFGLPDVAGDKVAVDVLASGLSTGVSVGAFDFAFHLAPGYVQSGDFIFGPGLGDPSIPEVLNSVTQLSGGDLEVTSISLLSGVELQALQGSGFRLGTLVLNASIVGGSALTMSGIVSDASGQPLAVTFPNRLVVGVPEPGTALPVLSALAAAVVFASRRTRAKRQFQ